MGVDMLALGAAAPVDPAAAAGLPPGQAAGQEGSTSFGEVVGRLLEGDAATGEVSATSKLQPGGGHPAETVPLLPTPDPEAATNAALLMLFADASVPRPLPPDPSGRDVAPDPAAVADAEMAGAPAAVVVTVDPAAPSLAGLVPPPTPVPAHTSAQPAPVDGPSPAEVATDAGTDRAGQPWVGRTAHVDTAPPEEGRPVAARGSGDRAVAAPAKGSAEPPVPARVEDSALPASESAAEFVPPESERSELGAAPERPAERPAEGRPGRMSPQAARLAAALAQGGAGPIAAIATATTAEIGRIVNEAARGEPQAQPGPAVHIEIALPEQAAPNAVREAATRFVSFDTSVAALMAEAFHVRASAESNPDTSSDLSRGARDRGAYDLRGASWSAAVSQRFDGWMQAVADPRLAAATAVPGAPASEGVVPAGSVPAGTHAAMGEVPGQIVRAMHLQWREGVGEAKLTLTPESLGEVTIALRVDRGVVTATVRADNPVTMEWIRSHQHELREALDEQGLRLDQFEVGVNPDDRRERDDSSQDQPRRRARPQPGADAPRFELVV